MKLIPATEMPSTGLFMLLYGETDVGKTCSVLQSAPGPVMWFQFEKRAHGLTLAASGRDANEITAVLYEDWQDLLAFHANVKNFDGYQTILSDGTSYLMNVELSGEIEDESYEALPEEKRSRKSLIASTKMSQEGFGGLSSNMFRYLKLLGRLAHEGKIVILTALVQDNPKWDRDLVAGPAFKGREFPSNAPGFFDLIGFVQHRHVQDQDGNAKIVYPPWVSFEDVNDDGFLCKYTGPRFGPARGPLHIGKLLNKINKTREVV